MPSQDDAIDAFSGIRPPTKEKTLLRFRASMELSAGKKMVEEKEAQP